MIFATFAVMLFGLAAAEENFELHLRPDVHLYSLLSPKLRITGKGFTSDFSMVVTTDAGQRTLTPDQDFTYTNLSSTQITMRKMPGTVWGDVKEGQSTMFLESFKMNGQEHIASPVVLATVVPEPMIYKNTSVIFQSETRRITMKGKNLKSKVVKLTFSPPLKIGVDYTQRVDDSKISLTLQPGKSWRAEPGPLKLLRVDTGPGPIRVAPPGRGGLIIAEVQADVGHASGVVVVPTADQLVYQSSPSLIVKGAGFSLEENGMNLLAFANGIRGRGTNFTITSRDANSLTLERNPKSVWRRNPDNLPGPLLLLSLNTGKGWVPLGSVRARRGRVVARVFEDPKVFPGNAELKLGQTHVLTISGAGFVQQPNGTTIITFDPPIDPDTFSFDPVNSKQALVTLESNGKWRDSPGPLTITSINTGPGPIFFNPPVVVANVIEATGPHASGIAVSVTHSSQKIYSDQKQIAILGSNFIPDVPISVEFKPGFGPEVDDFEAKVQSPNTLLLKLKEGKQWVRFHTVMIVTKIVNGDHSVDLVDGDGIAIATAFPAPDIIMPEKPHIYATHSKSFYLRGYFGDELDSLTLFPTEANAYEASLVAEELVKISLQGGSKWAEVEGEGAVDLKLTNMDLGAGPYAFPDGGLVIATVYADSDSVTCDDSCMYANNGMCDDGSDIDSWIYDDMDDDFGYSDDAVVGDDDWYLGDFSNDWADGNDYDDDFIGALCEVGTDCTDCGGVHKSVHTCDNTCEFAKDYVCDDPRGTGLCELGSDCDDCGDIGVENGGVWEAITDGYDDDADFPTWFEDDDFYISMDVDDDEVIFSDESFAADIDSRWDRWVGADGNIYTSHDTKVAKAGPSPALVFVSLLQALAYSIGAIVICGGCFVFYQMYKGGGVNFPIPDNSLAEDQVNLFDKSGKPSVPMTPDSVTTNA
mmetsp:Transcript_15349/g.58412  ORF Transcript_15349/g.58412 Transcript_15349/m.58412 type:complete len:926 (-) Transcript_15349:233-3010(-)